MPKLNDLPPLADFVTVADIDGFPEQLEVRVSIRKATATAEVAGEGKQSTHLGGDGKPLPYVHNVTNSLTELNKQGLERLAYWHKGFKGANNYILNQAMAEYLNQHQEAQWPIPSDSPVSNHVDALPKIVTQDEAKPYARRSQRDYSLPFKLAVVGEVGRGELSYKQAQRRYGIQGRSTVLDWCRRYATHFANSQAAVLNSPSANPIADPNLEQRIKQLETHLRDHKQLTDNELMNIQNLNLFLRTML